MPIFGRKKKEVREAKKVFEKPIPVKKPITMKKPIPTEKPKEKEPKKPSFAPLFVKLTRYKQILNAMNYLKTTMVMIRNTFSILNELERLKAENLKMIQSAMEKVEKRLLTLDSEFMRPSGFTEELPELHDVESLEATIADLKSQIDQLKTELERMA